MRSPPLHSLHQGAVSSASVLIVGAGLAGLTAAYRLHQAGIAADIVEASSRVGGRVYSLPGAVGTSLTAELGGEFIDSDHCCLLSLAAELGLTLLDRHLPQPNLVQTTFFLNGQRVAETALSEDFKSVAPQIARDLNQLKGFRTYRSRCPAAMTLDRLSLTQYLERLPLSSDLRQLIETAYTMEFGRAAAEQSCLNFLYLIGIHPLKVLGNCDERFYIAGGNDQIAQRLGARLSNQIQIETALVGLSRCPDGHYRATLQSGLRVSEKRYERVLLTLPFSVLRMLDLRIKLPLAKRLAIDTLGYGTNAKLTTGYRQRFWHQHRATGYSLTDLECQSTWESDLSQHDPQGAGLLTSFIGGRQGWELSGLSPERQAERLYPHWEKLFPGLAAAQQLGGVAHSWVRSPYSQGSYACYLVGQWTQFYGVERERVENLFFAGEHCSVDYQACMEGACQTGEQAAFEIRQDLGRMSINPSPQQRYGPAFRQGSKPVPFHHPED